jgi:hypothetical protein
LAALAFPWSALSNAGTPKVGTRHAKVHPSRNDFWSSEFQIDAEPLRHIPALGPYAVAQAVPDGLYGALLCRPHRRGIFGRGRYRDLDVDALSQATRDGPSGLQPKKNDRRNRVERRPKFREEARQGGPLEEGTFRASWRPWDSLFHSSVHDNNQKLNLPAGLSRLDSSPSA